MKILVMVLCLCLIAVPALAQEPEPHPFWQDAAFLVPMGALIALRITDSAQTAYALQDPAYGEGNQLLTGYIEAVGTDGIQPLNIVITAGITAGLTYAWLKSEKGWQKVVMYCVVGAAVIVQAWVVDSNSRLAFE